MQETMLFDMPPAPGENEIVTCAGGRDQQVRGRYCAQSDLWMLLCCPALQLLFLTELRRQANKCRISFGSAVRCIRIGRLPNSPVATRDSKGETEGPTSAYSLHIASPPALPRPLIFCVKSLRTMMNKKNQVQYS
jgi:hypothetical protein